jgi:hypothetical protein
VKARATLLGGLPITGCPIGALRLTMDFDNPPPAAVAEFLAVLFAGFGNKSVFVTCICRLLLSSSLQFESSYER